MASKAEKIAETIKYIENNLNGYGQDKERFLLENSNDFRTIKSLKIAEVNEKCGINYYGYWLKNINGDNWFYKISKKMGIPDEFFLEILSEKAAKDLGIQTVESSIVKLSHNSNSYGIMSSDYRRTGYDITTGKDIIYDYLDYLYDYGKFNGKFNVKSFDELDKKYNVNSLSLIKEALTYHFSKNNLPVKANSMCELIYNQLVTRYIFCYLTLQKDYHLGNWEIAENEHGAYLVPMYDMELSFRKDFYDHKNTTLKYSINSSINPDDDFKLFCQENDNIILVERIYNILKIENIMKYMNYIPNIPDNLKKDILITYNEHYLKVGSIIEEAEYLNNKKTI